MKISSGEKAFSIFNYVFLAFFAFITLYPLLHVLFSSLSDPDLLMRHTGVMFSPRGFSLAAYRVVLRNRMLLTSYANTIIYVFGGTALSMVFTILGAYVLSRTNFFWRKYIIAFIMLTMFISGGMIPNYLLIEALGMIDTRWAIIIPGAISTMNLLIMRTGFAAIPVSLEESAKMDGASDLTVLIRIFLPVSTPVIAVMLLYYGVGQWNAWFNSMICLRSRELYPMQLILREILIMNQLSEMASGTDIGDKERIQETIKYSTIIVSTVPILLVYPFLQKYFVKGIMLGSLKE
jgi:putative aldouronate transport system permease protein